MDVPTRDHLRRRQQRGRLALALLLYGVGSYVLACLTIAPIQMFRGKVDGSGMLVRKPDGQPALERDYLTPWTAGTAEKRFLERFNALARD